MTSQGENRLTIPMNPIAIPKDVAYRGAYLALNN